MKHPADHLQPIWRQMPGNGTVFTMALDPREADFVLARGYAMLDGVRWWASTEGWGDDLDFEGRRTIRGYRAEPPAVVSSDPTDRWTLRLLRLLRAA